MVDAPALKLDRRRGVRRPTARMLPSSKTSLSYESKEPV